jgi:nitrite reductase/ring-hydroxylating ferredoxin subunit
LGAGVLEYDSDRLVLSCPWHGWEFDVETGRAIWDESYRAKTYATTVRDGRVLVEIGGSADA